MPQKFLKKRFLYESEIIKMVRSKLIDKKSLFGGINIERFLSCVNQKRSPTKNYCGFYREQKTVTSLQLLEITFGGSLL